MIAWFILGGVLLLILAALGGYVYARRGITSMVSEAAEKTIKEIDRRADEALDELMKKNAAANDDAKKATDAELEEEMNR